MDDDRAFILDQDNWPMWPWLPLKMTGTLKPAFLDGRHLTRHLEDGIPLQIHAGLDEPRELLEYLNVDAMLADGWVVD